MSCGYEMEINQSGEDKRGMNKCSGGKRFGCNNVNRNKIPGRIYQNLEQRRSYYRSSNGGNILLFEDQNENSRLNLAILIFERMTGVIQYISAKINGLLSERHQSVGNLSNGELSEDTERTSSLIMNTRPYVNVIATWENSQCILRQDGLISHSQESSQDNRFMKIWPGYTLRIICGLFLLNSVLSVDYDDDHTSFQMNGSLPLYSGVKDFKNGFYIHRGIGNHQGDTGKAQMVFTADALHHGASGEIFISGSDDQAITDGALDLNQLHQRMADDVTAFHEANIIKKTKEKEIKTLEAEIAAEKSQQKQEEIARLKQLDSVAEINEHKSPEVLGKKVIPVVSFTQETLPLRHHIRYVLKMIDAVQQTENAAIDAQKQIARLDDITDKLAIDNLLFTDAKRYQAFKKAAGIEDTVPRDIPVTSINGEFYVAPGSFNANHPEDFGHPVLDKMPNAPAPDGHLHFEDHGHINEPTKPLATHTSMGPPVHPNVQPEAESAQDKANAENSVKEHNNPSKKFVCVPVTHTNVPAEPFDSPDLNIYDEQPYDLPLNSRDSSTHPNFRGLMLNPLIDDINKQLHEGEHAAKARGEFIKKLSRQ